MSMSMSMSMSCPRPMSSCPPQACDRLREYGLRPSAADFLPLVRLHVSLLEQSGGSCNEAARRRQPPPTPPTHPHPSHHCCLLNHHVLRLDTLLRWLADENPPLCDAQLAQLHACFNPPAAATATKTTGAGWPTRAVAEESVEATPVPWRVERCIVDDEAMCSGTGLPVRAIHISAEARAELRGIIPRLAGSKAKGEEFARFGSWVDEHGPFEYVLDGANIVRRVKARTL